MLTIREAKKVPYEQIDSETEGFIYDLFRKYVVRKQISDASKELNGVFARKMRTSVPSVYATCFNVFNNAFADANLINYLHYDEINSPVLKTMSEEQFNKTLNHPSNSFERKMALMSFSHRACERLTNRAEFPVMIAYANMQQKVILYARTYPQWTIDKIIKQAAYETRAEFVETNGKRINETEIAEKRTDFQVMGKTVAPLWKAMIESYKSRLRELKSVEAVNFVFENFVFTNADKKSFEMIYENAKMDAQSQVQEDRLIAEQRAENDPDYYDIADYDEVHSSRYADEVYLETITNAMNMILEKYLKDLICQEKKKD